MPDASRTSAPGSPFGRIRREGAYARVVGGLAAVAIGTFALLATATAGSARTAGAPEPGAPPLTYADLVVAPRLTSGESRQIADTEHTAVAAAQPTSTPTATAVPPTATAVPPTATPRPRQASAPAADSPASTPVPPPAPAPPAPGLDTSPMDAYSRALFEGTNARRASQGLPPLRENGQLNGIARIRSRDMADHNYFAHVSPITGDDAFKLMDRYGVPFGWAGENLAKNNYPDDQAEQVAEQALWDSPPHRENILGPHYTDIGIALVVDATGMKYFTIVFTGPG